MQIHRPLRVLTAFLAATMIACNLSQSLPIGGGQVQITMMYGSEKRAWLIPLIEEFNAAEHQIESAPRS